AVNDVLNGIDREELIKKMVSVEFSRFARYYKKNKDLNTSSVGDYTSSNDDGAARYFINVGERDGYDWKTLKDFIQGTMELGRDDVFRVDVKESFSFFNTDAKHTDAILQKFSEFKLNGRFINVEVSKTKEGGGGRNRGDRKRIDGRKGKEKSFGRDKSFRRDKKIDGKKGEIGRATRRTR